MITARSMFRDPCCWSEAFPLCHRRRGDFLHFVCHVDADLGPRRSRRSHGGADAPRRMRRRGVRRVGDPADAGAGRRGAPAAARPPLAPRREEGVRRLPQGMLGHAHREAAGRVGEDDGAALARHVVPLPEPAVPQLAPRVVPRPLHQGACPTTHVPLTARPVPPARCPPAVLATAR